VRTAGKPAAHVLQAKLQEGLAHHQAGRLQQAEAAYLQVLQKDPGQPDALRLHSIILSSQGNHVAAIPLLESALRARPNFPEACYSLGNAHQAEKNFPEAVRRYRQALKLRSDFPEARCNLGNALAALGQYEEAIVEYRAALKLSPQLVEAHNNLSAASRKLGRLDDAISSAERALKLRPQYADALNNLGIALRGRGRLAEAIAAYRQAVAVDPCFAEAFYNLGQVLDEARQSDAAVKTLQQALAIKPHYAEAYLAMGLAWQNQERWEEARAAYRQCLLLDPHCAEALNNLGTTFQKEKRYADAAVLYRQAVALKPAYSEAWSNLGAALQGQKHWDEAVTMLRKSLELSPGYADAFNNLGVVLKLKNDLPAAEAALRKAISLKPDYAEAHNNLANLLLSFCRGQEALGEYRRAAELDPSLPLVEFNEGAARLLLGDLKGGWPKYERRFDTWPKHELRHTAYPRWTGREALAGKRILVHAEQGLGDTLQFVRYVALLSARDAVVYVEVQPALKSLLTSLEGATKVFAQGEPLPEFDFQCPLLSLPLAFDTGLSTIPAPVGYVRAPADRSALWRARLGGAGPLVGIVWSGNPNHENDHNRSLRLAEFSRIFSAAEIRFVSLQKQPALLEEAALSAQANVSNIAPQLTDFADTAAVIANLDAVIAVDTSVAHLAGALGKPIWILLPFAPDWRWLLGRDDTPWYPSAKLYRQEKIGDWSAPLERVLVDLEKMARQSR
jgi:tetratricopeptide (TPR) repeat protein